jgi:RNA polymerase sigma factor (sigma-70 family)
LKKESLTCSSFEAAFRAGILSQANNAIYMPLYKRSQTETRSDAELVVACLAGQDDAWKALIARHQAFILRVPVRYGLSAADAQDIFQNVCLKLCLHIGEIQDPGRLVGWLGAVTRQECLRLLRRPAPDQLVEEQITEAGSQIHPLGDPEAVLLEEERLHLLRRALSELPPECIQLLTLLYGPDPVAYADAADELGWPLGSIGPRRARCLGRLEKKLHLFRE